MADSVCFAIETVDKLFAFKANSSEARDAWVDWICKSIDVPLGQATYKGDYEFIVLDKALPPKNHVLAKVQAVLEKHQGFAVPDVSSAMASCLQSNMNRIKGLEFRLLERNRHSASNTEVEHRLKERIQLLEVDIESVHKIREAVTDLRSQLDEEHRKFDVLKRKADDNYKKAVQGVILHKALKAEIDVAFADRDYMENIIKYRLKSDLSSAGQARLDSLKHGFVSYCCLLDSIENKPDMGLYKKKQISISQDARYLELKTISLFNSQTTFIDMDTITSVIEGTESEDLEPYEDMLYLTIMTSNSVYILAIEPKFGFYFEALQELFLDFNNYPSITCNSTSQMVLEGTIHQLKQRQLLVSKFYDHWKMSQKDSICRASPEACLKEAARLSTLVQIATVAFSGWNLEDYLRFERLELRKVEDSLNGLLAEIEVPFNS
mmetsp:Transcript_18774/g.34037  ORF Transcript_18774/g.34037 Transcript_18774/m.34037 type:complete len:436 (-) Transcript_18774:8-1315(-)